MRSRFKYNQLNWKYLLSELFLIVMGILLAINFNECNNQNQINKRFAIAFQNIQQEIKENALELEKTLNSLQSTDSLFQAINPLQEEDRILTSPAHLQVILKVHAEDLVIMDSMARGKDLFAYEYGLSVSFEQAELSQVSWQATQNSGLIQYMNFTCLKEIIQIYNLQEFYLDEQKKITSLILEQDLDKLSGQIEILIQFAQALQERCNQLDLNLKECRMI